MDDVIQRGSVIEITDINDSTLIGSVVDFRMYYNEGKYSTFIFVEESEDWNLNSEHYGQAAVAIDDIKKIKIHKKAGRNRNC